ncbi:MAG: sugar ABC transporter permease [Oscillospiraceae bacterium]|nr:sugar ABC transporter permease [Oscillospiraceae bacterium]
MKHKNFSYAKYGYIFSIPFILAFLTFSLYPLVYTVSIGFTDRAGVPTKDAEYGILRDAEGDLDPFGNFRSIANNRTFRTSLQNTFKIWGMNFIPQILLALILAVWFTSRRVSFKGKGLFKVLFYMPNIITAATIALLFRALLLFPKGVVNDTLIAWGLIDQAINFEASPVASQIVVAFIQFWMWYGYTMLIFISGILGMNPEMFESADIDGANSFQQFLYITLPNLRTIMLYTLVTSLIGGLNMFDIPHLYASGGPDNATTTTSIFIYNQAFLGRYLYNTAAAASLIVFAIIAVLSSILFFLMRDKEAAKLRKLKRQDNNALKKSLLGVG